MPFSGAADNQFVAGDPVWQGGKLSGLRGELQLRDLIEEKRTCGLVVANLLQIAKFLDFRPFHLIDCEPFGIWPGAEHAFRVPPSPDPICPLL